MSTPARILMVEGDTTPPAPNAGQVLLYAKTSGTFYSLDSNGVETPLGGGAGGGTVTSVGLLGSNGITVSNSPVTTSGTISVGLGNITPTSVNASGTVTGSNLSGTNTGDQTITLTGDVTGSGTGTFSTTLANSGVTANTYGSATQIPVFTVDAKGRITSVTNTTVSAGTGTVTSVGLTSANSAISVTGSPVTTSGSFTVTANNFTSSAAGIVPQSGGGTTNFLRADGTWAAPPTGTGTVTSVTGSGGSTGMTLSGGPITTSGTLTLGGTLNVANGGTGATTLTGYVKGNGTSAFTASSTVPGSDVSGNISGNAANVTGTVAIANGGTGATTAAGARTAILPTQTGNNGRVLSTNGTDVSWVDAATGSGTVTSINVAGGSTGLTFTGGPVTTSGTITMAGTLALASGGTGATTAAGARTALGATTLGSNLFTATNPGAVTFLRVNADNTVSTLDAASFRTAIGAGTGNGNGTVTSVGVSSSGTYSSALTIGSSPVTSSGTITITPNLFGTSAPGIVPQSGGGTTNFLRADGTWAEPPGGGGSGTVTSVSVAGTSGRITSSGSPITTSGTVTLDLATTAVTPGTYGSGTQVPVMTVDAYGRVTGVTNTTITGGGSSTPEIVVFKYSSGGSGNFNSGDNIVSQTSGVTATITDGTNCIVTYSFTGKSNPPRSIMVYGQNFTTNDFSILDTTSLPSNNRKIVGGGTATSPDIANGIFTSSNIVTLQTRMTDTLASAGLGQRAHLVVVFGF